MKLDTKHFRGNACFIPHAIEAEDFVGTLWDERGERRHIVAHNETSEWSVESPDYVVGAGGAVVLVDANERIIAGVELAPALGPLPAAEQEEVATTDLNLSGERKKNRRK